MSYIRASENVQRKADHIHVALNEDVEFHTRTTGLEKYSFIYEALPEISLEEVDTSTTLLGKRLSMPLIISSMTGGTPDTARYNRLFAEAAQHFGIAMGVGSQRVAFEMPMLEDTFRVRDIAPDILLFANLGAVQLNNGYGVEECIRAVDMIGADALILHLNPLQECVQTDGNTNFHNLSTKIADICDALDVPVIVKEVGHGISARTAKLLEDVGVDAIDVAGAGGTSWAKVESHRATDPRLISLGAVLGEWGLPTVDSLLAVRSVSPNRTVIASGGIRTGDDIAKCIALGADATGMALPLLKCASQSKDALFAKIDQLQEELTTIMLCTGSKNVASLRTGATLAKM